MIKLKNEALIDKIVKEPETGMGYWVVAVKLKSGKIYEQAVFNSGYITQVKDHEEIPFSEDDIADIQVSHKKWRFKH